MAPYGLGKLYIIRNSVNPKLYIGSTVCALSRRMVQHRSNAKTGNMFPLYEAMRTIGVDKFYIEFLSDFPCERKEQLNAEEGKRIRELNTLAPNGYNTLLAGRSKAECYQDKKADIAEKHKQYYEANRETVNEKHKAYWEANREALLAQKRIYSTTNREAINARQREKKAASKLAAKSTPASE